eukprot:1139150-Pelagomonas_calceolata.AAC.2
MCMVLSACVRVGLRSHNWAPITDQHLCPDQIHCMPAVCVMFLDSNADALLLGLRRQWVVIFMQHAHATCILMQHAPHATCSSCNMHPHATWSSCSTHAGLLSLHHALCLLPPSLPLFAPWGNYVSAVLFRVFPLCYEYPRKEHVRHLMQL